jgi:hypothetical protein
VISVRTTTALRPRRVHDATARRQLQAPVRQRITIGRRYTLDEIVEAHRYADTGHKIGNVAVLIGDQTDGFGP